MQSLTLARPSCRPRRTALVRLAAAALPPALAAGCANPADRAHRVPAGGGRFVTTPAFASAHAAPRRVTVWLPPGHDSATGRHRVLYMHDGQNLFDPADAYGGQTWGVVPALLALRAAGRVAPTIVVGVWNTPLRRQEYGPAAPLARLPAAWRDQVYGGPALSDGYLRFLVEELKPHIDATYNTLPGPADTVVVGSSMGGLASLYALVQHPGVFGAAACVSTHWPMSTQPAWITPPGDPRAAQAQQALRDWLAERLPAPGAHRLYFDHGTLNLDALYPPLQAQVDAVLASRGWQRGTHFTSQQIDGGDHNEAAWRARVDQPLRFLLPP
jgi:enterochelin esterase-like enzyme